MKYYAQHEYGRGNYSWSLWQRSKGGDRRLGEHMSERTARRLARLLNEDENRNNMMPLSTDLLSRD